MAITEQLFKNADMPEKFIKVLIGNWFIAVDYAAATIDWFGGIFGKSPNLRTKLSNSLSRDELDTPATETRKTAISVGLMAGSTVTTAAVLVTAVAGPSTIANLIAAQNGDARLDKSWAITQIANITGVEPYPTDMAAAKQFCTDLIEAKAAACEKLAVDTNNPRLSAAAKNIRSINIEELAKEASALKPQVYEPLITNAVSAIVAGYVGEQTKVATDKIEAQDNAALEQIRGAAITGKPTPTATVPNTATVKQL